MNFFSAIKKCLSIHFCLLTHITHCFIIYLRYYLYLAPDTYIFSIFCSTPKLPRLICKVAQICNTKTAVNSKQKNKWLHLGHCWAYNSNNNNNCILSQFATKYHPLPLQASVIHSISISSNHKSFAPNEICMWFNCTWCNFAEFHISKQASGCDTFSLSAS